MTNKPRKKGTTGENIAVTFLQRWWKGASRTPLKGIRDTGDIDGTPFVVSVKNTARFSVPKWLEELRKQKLNANSNTGIIMARWPRGKWTFILDEETMRALLDAVHGGEGSDEDA